MITTNRTKTPNIQGTPRPRSRYQTAKISPADSATALVTSTLIPPEDRLAALRRFMVRMPPITITSPGTTARM